MGRGERDGGELRVECSVLSAAAVGEDKDIGEAKLLSIVVDNLGERLVVKLGAALRLREDSPDVRRFSYDGRGGRAPRRVEGLAGNKYSKTQFFDVKQQLAIFF